MGAEPVRRGWLAVRLMMTGSRAFIVTKGGKLLLRCHAGCDQRDVINALRTRGLWPASSGRPSFRAGNEPAPPPGNDADVPAPNRMRSALAIWGASVPPEGTAVEFYLRSRRLVMAPPPAIRFHSGLKHPTGAMWPAMVALVTRGIDAEPIGIHRTFLAHDGAGKVPVHPAKMMLGRCRGGVVRLGQPREVLMVGEGIETCLATMQATGHAAWAALSTSGLRSLHLPQVVRDIIVLADGDEAGEAAAQECARRWHREGRRARIARPPQGKDFNDLLIDSALTFNEGER